jgi:hypothetical protein
MAQDGGGSLWVADEDGGLGYQEETKVTLTDEEAEAIELTAGLINQYALLTTNGDREAYSDFRNYKLDAAIRKLSRMATKGQNPEILYSAIALASCDEDGERLGGFWSPLLAKAIKNFDKKDVDNAMNRLSPTGQERVRRAIYKYLPPGDTLFEELAAPRGDDTLDSLEQGGWTGGQGEP